MRSEDHTVLRYPLTLTSLGPFGHCLREKVHELAHGGPLEEGKGGNIFGGCQQDSWLDVVADDGDGEETHCEKLNE
jgi:hypothetical protein